MPERRKSMPSPMRARQRHELPERSLFDGPHWLASRPKGRMARSDAPDRLHGTVALPRKPPNGTDGPRHSVLVFLESINAGSPAARRDGWPATTLAPGIELALNSIAAAQRIRAGEAHMNNLEMRDTERGEQPADE